jgi:hypothetical protein
LIHTVHSKISLCGSGAVLAKKRREKKAAELHVKRLLRFRRPELVTAVVVLHIWSIRKDQHYEEAFVRYVVSPQVGKCKQADADIFAARKQPDVPSKPPVTNARVQNRTTSAFRRTGTGHCGSRQKKEQALKR